MNVATINEASLVAAQIERSLSHLKEGTPRIYGDWFGRPGEDRRTVVGATADGHVLTLKLDAGEVIKVWYPTGLECREDGLIISSARRVVIEWTPQGAGPGLQEMYFREYTVHPSGIEARTNVDRYTVRLRPKVGYPAMELS